MVCLGNYTNMYMLLLHVYNDIKQYELVPSKDKRLIAYTRKWNRHIENRNYEVGKEATTHMENWSAWKIVIICR